MAISCAYCGGEHDRPADVRACWTEHGEQDLVVDDDVPLPSEPVSGPSSPVSRPGSTAAACHGSASRRRAEPVVERAVAVAAPGPDQLGRHALVVAGAAVSEPWGDAARTVVGAGHPEVTDPGAAGAARCCSPPGSDSSSKSTPSSR